VTLLSRYTGNAVARKGTAGVGALARFAVRASAGPEAYRGNPPLLANAVPKSGTQLLLQILRALPGTRYYGGFLASTPSLTLRERSTSNLQRRIGRLAPGEVAGAHLFHHPEIAAALAARNVAQAFLIRDPRDVAVSEMHYLTRRAPWHRMYPYFARLPDDAARLSLAICGLPGDGAALYPDIGRRFGRYLGWLEEPGVLAVRYEDLISTRRSAALRSILVKVAEHREADRFTDGNGVARIVANIRPERSPTFRVGRAGAWSEVFTERHRDEMAAVAGELLVTLGYEAGRSW